MQPFICITYLYVLYYCSYFLVRCYTSLYCCNDKVYSALCHDLLRKSNLMRWKCCLAGPPFCFRLKYFQQIDCQDILTQLQECIQILICHILCLESQYFYRYLLTNQPLVVSLSRWVLWSAHMELSAFVLEGSVARLKPHNHTHAWTHPHPHKHTYTHLFVIQLVVCDWWQRLNCVCIR